MRTSQKLDDRELVERSQRGDKAAFGALVDRYKAMIHGFITSQIRDFSEAEDLTQNTFIRAYRKVDQLRDPEAFRGWLRTIASAECKTWLAARRPMIPLDALDISTLHDQQALYQWHERQNRPDIEDALDKLKDDHREVLNLHYLGGLTSREIAGDLGLSVQAVEKRLSRGRSHLRTAMTDSLDDSFSKYKLPEDFTERVLRKLSLCPVLDGVVTAEIGDSVGTVVIGVDSGGTSPSFIYLTMERADAEALLFRQYCTSPDAKSRIGFANATLSVLAALGIRVKEIRLGLNSDQRCSATAVLSQNGTESEAQMRANDAMCLAGHGQLSLYAEDAVVAAKRVAVPEVEGIAPYEVDSMEDHIRVYGQLDRLVRRAFANGLKPGTGPASIICRADRAGDTVEVQIVGLDNPPVALSLREYSAALMHALAQRDPDYCDRYRHDDGSQYRAYYRPLHEGVEILFVPHVPDGHG